MTSLLIIVCGNGTAAARSSCLALVVLLAFASAAAQTRTLNPPQPKDPIQLDKSTSSDNEPPLGPLDEELKAKRRIKLEEKEYKDNLDRAREAAALGSQLRETYKQNRSLSREDTKKLDRLEKLVKRIRSLAGGSDEAATLDNPPRELDLALSQLADLLDSLRKVVEKTPRQVVSAVVIEQANAVLQLARLTRDLFH